jgi:hypothetical protein
MTTSSGNDALDLPTITFGKRAPKKRESAKSLFADYLFFDAMQKVLS